MDRIFEWLLKKMSGLPLPLSKFGANTAFHIAAVSAFGISVSKLDIPGQSAVLFFLLLLLSFWICAAFFGPLRS
jgi:hypothetical protein